MDAKYLFRFDSPSDHVKWHWYHCLNQSFFWFILVIVYMSVNLFVADLYVYIPSKSNVGYDGLTHGLYIFFIWEKKSWNSTQVNARYQERQLKLWGSGSVGKAFQNWKIAGSNLTRYSSGLGDPNLLWALHWPLGRNWEDTVISTTYLRLPPRCYSQVGLWTVKWQIKKQ